MTNLMTYPIRIMLTLVLLALLIAAATCTSPAPPLVSQPPPKPQETATPMCTRTLNIAHRGARSLAPENTLAAAAKALEIGADMWEFDVAVSADGELFLLHDDRLDRTSNVRELFPGRAPWSSHTFTLAEIRQLDFGAWFVALDPFKQIAAGKVSPQESARYRGEKAPTLREALEFTRQNNWRANIEIKDQRGKPGDATVVEKVVALVDELRVTDRVLISSFNHSYLERVKKANPAIATGALVSTPDPDPLALLRRLGAQAYNPNVKAIEPAEVRRIRDQGFDVFIYTVNDEPTMRSLVEARASGIFTDFPQTLKPLSADCR
ncbi:MAG: glycerophosphodiester phosphodiesterase [Chloroflexi bacterium]|nr:glycerophosphodiester phosphodiesterase [Chloroflexota bacterium]